MASLQVSLPYLATELANHLWQSTLFMILAAALTLLFRRNSAVIRYRLWLAASIKFLVPFSLLIGIGSQMGWRSPMPQFRQTAVPIAIRQISEPFAVPSSIPTSFQTQQSQPVGISPVPMVFAAVWITGIALILLTWWRKWAQVAGLVRKADAFGTSDMPRQIPILTSPENLEPGVFGIFRPVLLLPAGVTRTLTGGQLESILCHEMMHVRGRDNVASVLHTFIEALFWFHPAVWWLGNRLVVERERACDEAVLQLGFDPADYAEGILKVCKSYLAAPACMAGISGIHLKNRIEAIMENRKAPRLTIWNKLLLASVAMGTIAVPLLTGLINAAEAPPASLQAMSAAVTPVSLPATVLVHAPVDDNIKIGEREKSKIGIKAGGSAVGGSFIGLNYSTNNFLGFGEDYSSTVQTAMLQTNVGVSFTEPYVTSVNWINEVAYIIADSEKKAFTQLTNDADRQAFIVNFWLVRDPTAGTPENEYKDEFYARIAYANAHFSSSSGIPGSKADRGRMYILNGAPDEIISHPTGGGPTDTFPYEIWRYRLLDNRSQSGDVIYEFVDSQRNGDYRLEYDPDVKFKLENARRRSTEQPATEKIPATPSPR
jgi:GWxTD domain-containing protein